MSRLIAAGIVLVLVSLIWSDVELRDVGMAQASIYHVLSAAISLQSQLGDTFLSSKHLNYLAAVAEFISEVRASS